MDIEFQKIGATETLVFDYQQYVTQVGIVLVVSWEKSLVSLTFVTGQKNALNEVRAQFPRAEFREKGTLVQRQLLRYIEHPLAFQEPMSIALSGTPFQMKVWKALVTIPFATTCFYSDLAKMIGRPTAVRAVASAVAKNPVAILIPCHRVIPRSGGIGKYHWGTKNKSALLTWERLSCSQEKGKIC